MFCHPFGLLSYSDTKSYQNLLVDAYGGTNGSYTGSTLGSLTLQTLFNLTYSGYYNTATGGIFEQGSYGYFWESQPYYNPYARALNFAHAYLGSQGANYKGRGFSLRCLVR